ncbi:adenylosuccinate lyase [Sesbania bispinosa]|nr:adenylosuccinate lyase [Sesbania bispinosa]
MKDDIRTSEHEDGIWGKMELVDENGAHPLGQVDASLDLVRRVPVRDADDHRLLAAIECAADTCSARWQLQRRAAVGTVDGVAGHEE